MKVFAKIVVRIFFTLLFRLELVDKHNVPLKGPVLLCANHQSELDMFAIGIGIKRWVNYIAKEELFKNPLVGAVLKSLGAFPVKRGKGDVGAIKAVYKLLSDGHVVGIFPEGTRVRKANRGKAKIKAGAGLIAVNARVPILPVAIVSDYKLFGKVKVIFGKPFNLEIDDSRKYSNEDLLEISEGIMQKVYTLAEGA